MKLKYTVTISVLALGLAAARAQDPKITVPGLTPSASAPATPAAAPATANFTDAQLVEEFGWFMGKRVGLTELALSPAEIEAFVKGISGAAGGKDSPYVLDQIGPKMDEFMQKKQAAYMTKVKQESMAQSLAFFNKLKENKNVVELPDGLRYEILKAGDGAYPKATDTVRVNYTGTLVDGTVFDATSQHQPVEPSEFPLNGVIAGWTEGIQKINKGGKIKLYVPPQLGYGDEGNQRIPPGATLIFEVELVDIKPASAAPAMPTPAGK